MFLGFRPTSKARMAPTNPLRRTLERMLAKRQLRLACLADQQVSPLRPTRLPMNHLGLQLGF